jgi:hypothetical protein
MLGAAKGYGRDLLDDRSLNEQDFDLGDKGPL